MMKITNKFSLSILKYGTFVLEDPLAIMYQLFTVVPKFNWMRCLINNSFFLNGTMIFPNSNLQKSIGCYLWSGSWMTGALFLVHSTVGWGSPSALHGSSILENWGASKLNGRTIMRGGLGPWLMILSSLFVSREPYWFCARQVYIPASDSTRLSMSKINLDPTKERYMGLENLEQNS